jgi:uncharacterized membrane protein YkoI
VAGFPILSSNLPHMKLLSTIIILFISFSLTDVAAFAEKRREVDSELKVKLNAVKKRCMLIPSKEIIQRVEMSEQGKVVKIKLIKRGQQSSYRVRVLTGENKRIRNLSLNACRAG